MSEVSRQLLVELVNSLTRACDRAESLRARPDVPDREKEDLGHVAWHLRIYADLLVNDADPGTRDRVRAG
jgi:hypothetical protein